MKTHRKWIRRFLPVVLCIFALASQPATAFTYVQEDGQLSPELAASTHTPPASFPPTALLAPQDFVRNLDIAKMMDTVRQDTVYTYTGDLSGEWPAIIGGVPYIITTRHTTSGTPIQMATQYVYEHMQASGLTVSYHDWDYYSYPSRNVVGVLTGTTQADEIVLITAHLDNMPYGGLAPGADDNASGSVGVLVAAEILSQFQFDKTLRFVFFTGEEQGMRGSWQYAQAASAAGDNIVAVYNMDMIAWNDTYSPPTLRLHTRTPGSPGYPGDVAIANVFTNVVNAYSLASYLTPIIDADGAGASDHASFWNKGYSAILAIEDDESDFNDYYHTQNDRLQNLDMTYFINYVKASVGTAAHLAGLQATGILTGVISDADTHEHIGGAQVQAQRAACCTHEETSDSMGIYTLTLPAGVYTVTASAPHYWTKPIAGVVVTTTTPNTLDIPLDPEHTSYIPIVFKDTT